MNAVLAVLRGLFANPRVKVALGALILAILSYFGLTGCASLTPVQSQAVAVHECAVAALEPVVGPLAPQILQAARAGGDIGRALLVHGVPVPEVIKAVQALEACIPEVQPVPNEVDP